MNCFDNLSQIKKAGAKKKKNTFIPEEVYKKISIKDGGEKLINFKKYCQKKKLDIVISMIWKEGVGGCFLRESAARRLEEAHKELKKINSNLTLKITDSYRPLKLQQKLYNKISKKIKASHPGLSARKLYDLVTQYIADPRNNPPHTTGGAVDLTIYDKNNKLELDMGSNIDEIIEASATFYDAIKLKQKKNRRLLYQVMTTAGFVNVPTEWWHYSFGDQYWAAYNGKKQALYASV